MIPVSVVAMAPLAESVLDTYNRVAEAREAREGLYARGISGVTEGGINGDFKSLLDRAGAVNLATQGRGINPNELQVQMGEELGRLNEVQGLLAASSPGSVIHLSLSSKGELFQTLPGGVQQPILLSNASRESINRMLDLASANNLANFTGNQEFALRAKV